MKVVRRNIDYPVVLGVLGNILEKVLRFGKLFQRIGAIKYFKRRSRQVEYSKMIKEQVKPGLIFIYFLRYWGSE